jgi:DNA-binding transcriptional LysR family regulator
MRLCRQNGGFEPKTAAEGGYILREQLLRDGLGVTFFAVDTGARQFANSGVLLKLEGLDYPLSEALFWDKRRKLGRAAERFREFIIAYYERSHEIPS